MIFVKYSPLENTCLVHVIHISIKKPPPFPPGRMPTYVRLALSELTITSLVPNKWKQDSHLKFLLHPSPTTCYPPNFWRKLVLENLRVFWVGCEWVLGKVWTLYTMTFGLRRFRVQQPASNKYSAISMICLKLKKFSGCWKVQKFGARTLLSIWNWFNVSKRMSTT